MPQTRILTRSVIENYKNAKLELTDELLKVYECPSDIKAALITLCQATNIDTVNDSFVTVGWTDYSDSNKISYFITEGNMPARSGLNVFEKSFFLEPGDAIWAKADGLNKIHLTLSVVEVS